MFYTGGMDFMNTLGTFFEADNLTLAKILFLGNLFLGLLVLVYILSNKLGEVPRRLNFFLLGKILQSLSWLALVCSRDCPLYVSISLGQSLFYTGFFFESLVILDLSKTWSRGLVRVQIFLLILVLVLFNFSLYTQADFLRMEAFRSYALFLILVIPACLFMFRSADSRLKTLLGSIYIIVFAVALVRANLILSETSLAQAYERLLEDFSLFLYVLLMHIGGAGFLLLMKEEADERIMELANRDALTGLMNRRWFMEQARVILSSHARFKEEVSLLFLDLDHFKDINDAYGHHFGDAVLRDFASALKINVRTCDLACRYGGEEFIVLLQKTGKDGAMALASRIQEFLMTAHFRERPAFSYTVSIGLVSRFPESGSVDTLESIIAESDRALYRAKESGRNCIVAF